MDRSADPDTSEALRLYGTAQAVAPPRLLVAGTMSCLFEEGAIRRLSWNGIEVIRGVSYLLRDADWGTAHSALRQLHVEERADRFEVRFELHMTLPEGGLTALARIEGTAEGDFSFRVAASARQPLRTNRCGFAVLHPADVAGLPLVVEHTDGSVDDVRFPALISPGQPVFDIRRLRHSPRPGLSVDCRLEAELPLDPKARFEMEDHRNWSDASFKTYVGSLLDPWPYELPAGHSLRQEVRIRIGDERPAAPANIHATKAPVLRPGAPTGARMPALGLGVPADLQALGVHERASVAALRPAWLLAEIDLDAPGQGTALASQLHAIDELAAQCGARLQLDVICPVSLAPSAAAALLARACADAACSPDALRPCPAPYLKSYQPQGQWPELPGLAEYARAFATAFAGRRIGGGMLTSFTELNRKPPPADHLQFIGHTTCPIVHAADDLSVMETLEALPHIVHSVKALWPSLAYRLGPVTLAMHRNPYGARPADNEKRWRVAMAADDPRHQGAFGAAWVAGYAAAVAPLGLEVLALNHSHGASGPLLRAEQPGWTPGACVPAWSVQQALVMAQGAAALAIEGLPAGVAGIAWAHASSPPLMLLANLGAERRELPLPPHWAMRDLSAPFLPDAPHRVDPVGPVCALAPYQVILTHA